MIESLPKTPCKQAHPPWALPVHYIKESQTGAENQGSALNLDDHPPETGCFPRLWLPSGGANEFQSLDANASAVPPRQVVLLLPPGKLRHSQVLQSLDARIPRSNAMISIDHHGHLPVIDRHFLDIFSTTILDHHDFTTMFQPPSFEQT